MKEWSNWKASGGKGQRRRCNAEEAWVWASNQGHALFHAFQHGKHNILKNGQLNFCTLKFNQIESLVSQLCSLYFKRAMKVGDTKNILTIARRPMGPSQAT